MGSSQKNSNGIPVDAKFSNGYQKVSPQDETDADSDTRCGIGPCKPKFLQPFSNMLSFSLYYGCSSLVTSALSMYLTSQVTTLEKQFGLSSSETGLLQSMNDIGFLAFVLFVSYFSRYAHKPRILGVCVVIFGFSAILSAVPHFISSDPVLNISTETNSSIMMNDGGTIDHFRGESVCTIGHKSKFQNATNPTCSKSETKSHNDAKFIALGIISAGMFFQGLAKSPRMALTQTYIDDNVIKTKTGIFIGIIACLSIFGPATAFAVGAQISRIYVTLEETELTVRDPRWIGAWWLGFIVFGLAALILSGPLFLFPRRMVIKSKNPEKERAARELQQVQRDERGFLDKFKDMPLAIFKLLTNVTYISILIAASIDFFSMAGGIAFAAKYFEVYFGLSTFKANMLMGTTTIVAASTGMLAGGILTTRLKLTLAGCLKVMIIARIVSGLISFIPLFLDCPPPQIVGLTDYGSSETFGRSSLDVSYACSGCNCADSPYFPVCGSDGRNFHSPCVAGCSSKRGYQYTNCTCVMSGVEVGMNITDEFTAVPGLCPAECNLVYAFVVSQVIGAFLGTMSAMPQTVAALRSVSEQEKTLSVGMSSFVHSLLGWTLGPVVFGYIIDGTCLMWHNSCSKQGSCAIYDVYRLRNTLNGIGLGGRFICVVIFAVCLIRLTCFSKTGDETKAEKHVKHSKDAEEKEKMLNDLEPIRVSSL